MKYKRVLGKNSKLNHYFIITIASDFNPTQTGSHRAYLLVCKFKVGFLMIKNASGTDNNWIRLQKLKTK